MKSKRQSLDYAGERRPTVSRLAARFSLLGGGIAWLLHLLIAYVISEFGCEAGWGDWHLAGVSMVAWLLILATLGTGAMAAAASWTAVHTGRVLRGSEGDKATVTSETKYFMAGVSRLLNGIFAFIIVVQGVPIFFFLREC